MSGCLCTAALSQSLAKLGNDAALVLCIRAGGEASPVAVKVFEVSEWGLILVDSPLTQQCLGQEGGELARTSRACEFLSLLQGVLSLQHCKSGLSPGDSDSLVSKQNRQVRFAIPPPQALVEVSVSLSRVKMCLACSESCSVMG